MSNTQQSPDPIVYVPTPITDKPEKDGYYYFMFRTDSDSFSGCSYKFEKGEWVSSDIVENYLRNCSHWLKPTPLSSLLKDKQKRIEELEAERDQAKKELQEFVRAAMDNIP